MLLDVPRRLNLTETRGDEEAKKEIGLLKFYKHLTFEFHLLKSP